MRVSVVICTLNRAGALRNTLEALRRQNFPQFEVVVVNGPSTDGTDVVVDEFADVIRAERCPIANLSVSRNIGIRSAAGDIVAFIDDDAIPEFDWLSQSIPAFDDLEVAGVGGIVFDHTGMSLQYRFSAANRFGEVISSATTPFDCLSVPGADRFPYLQGTNALFRRSVLERVGGFDETYDYYLDETDLCCRIIDAGFVLRQLADAPVHHKFLPSSVRDHQRVVTNDFPIVKNHLYFGYRHALDAYGESEVLDRGRQFLEHRVAEAEKHELSGRLPAGAAARNRADAERGFDTGVQLGRKRRVLRLGPVSWPAPEFKPYPSPFDAGRRRYVLVSSGYGTNMTGGVARYTTDLAAGLAEAGTEVRVITSTTAHSTVDLEDGVWVHRLSPVTSGAEGVEPATFTAINDFTTAVADELERLGQWATIDLVYGSIWDVELLGALRRSTLPVMVHLVTPAAVAAEEAGWLSDPGTQPAIHHLIKLEREVLTSADLLHANGRPIIATMADRYPHALDPARVHVAHLGLADRVATPSGSADEPCPDDQKADDQLNVLFVGRLEARKGIDLVLGTITELAERFPHVSWTIVGKDSALSPGGPLVGAQFLVDHAEKSWIGRVEMLGGVCDDTLHELYERSDLVVAPSRYESFGLVMLEAMMHGRPLVSSCVGGIVEVVRDGYDGILVPPGDQPAVTSAVAALIGDRSRRDILGANGRRRYEEYFGTAPMTARFLGAARRLRLHQPAPPSLRVDTGTVQEEAAAFERTRLDVGSRLTFGITASSLWRLAISTDTGGRAMLTNARRSGEIELAPGRIARIEIESDSRLVVTEGSIDLRALIELAGTDAD